MNKFNFMFGAVALVAGLTLSSCASDDNDGVVKEVKVQMGNTLKIKSNVAATFTFDGQTKTGTEAEFSTKATKGVLTVSAEGYISQESQIEFGESSLKSIEITMMEKASNEVAQESAKGTTVYSTPNSWGAVAGIEVPADVAINGSDKSFSIASYEVANAIDVNNLVVGEEISSPVMAFDIQPKGVSFSRPVKLTATMPEGVATNFEFVATNGEQTVPVMVKDGVLSADIDNIGPRSWVFSLLARIINVQVGRDYITYVAPQRPINPGNSNIVPMRYGYEILGVYGVQRALGEAFRLIGSFLNSLFGAPVQTEDVPVVLPVDYDGKTYELQVVHEYKDVEFVFGGQTFSVRIYTGVASIVLVNTHSGASTQIK